MHTSKVSYQPKNDRDGLMILDVIHEDENFKDILNSVVSIKEKRIN